MTLPAHRSVASPIQEPPRYASYPTASRFGEDVGAERFDDWLAALPPGAAVALHLHVPFCRRLCRFCCCRTQAVNRLGPLEAYLAALHGEIERAARRLPAGVRVVEVHWLGGSPTILTPAMMRELDRHVRGALPVAKGAGLTAEIEPHGVDAERLEALLGAGLRRARLGLQDFAPRVQRAIDREQDAGRVAATVAALRGRGVAIDADLLYGLPLQDRASVEATCAVVAALAPERVGLVGYAHVPWMAKRQRAICEDSLPGLRARRAQFFAAAAALRRAGYVRCGLDHFARPGDALAEAAAARALRRDLLGYCERAPDAVIGLGAASISRFAQGYVQNVAGTGAYMARIAAGGGAGVRGAALRLEDRVRARAIEMLLCERAVDLGRLVATFGDFARVIEPDLDRAAERFAGRTRRMASGLSVDDDGPLLARAVAHMLDARAARAA